MKQVYVLAKNVIILILSRIQIIKIIYISLHLKGLDPKMNKNMIASDHPGDEIEIKIVIKEFLKIIREKYVNQYINNYNLTDIKWVITVPPLWDIKGKKLMQEQAKNAGMVNLDVVLEPEAASLAIFYEDNPTIILININ